MTKIENRYIDLYELGTREKRAYMCRVSSIYEEDNIESTAIITTAVMNKTVIVV